MEGFREEFAKIKRLCESREYTGEIERIKQAVAQRDLVLYGAGVVGVSLASALRYHGMDVTCFCDKNKTGVQKETGLPIISPQTLLNDYSEANIVISSPLFMDEIKLDLCALGIASERIVTKHFFNFIKITPQDVKSHLDDYERVYGLLHDDSSKNVFLSRLKCSMTPSPLIPLRHAISAASPSLQYFDPDIITLSYDEVFVDGGMYTGDTADEFFKHVGGSYRHYHGFEPDMENYAKASKNLGGKPNTTISAKGLWSGETRLCFNGGLAVGSKLTEADSDSFIEVTALDMYFSATPPPISNIHKVGY